MRTIRKHLGGMTNIDLREGGREAFKLSWLLFVHTAVERLQSSVSLAVLSSIVDNPNLHNYGEVEKETMTELSKSCSKPCNQKPLSLNIYM